MKVAWVSLNHACKVCVVRSVNVAVALDCDEAGASRRRRWNLEIRKGQPKSGYMPSFVLKQIETVFPGIEEVEKTPCAREIHAISCRMCCHLSNPPAHRPADRRVPVFRTKAYVLKNETINEFMSYYGRVLVELYPYLHKLQHSFPRIRDQLPVLQLQ